MQDRLLTYAVLRTLYDGEKSPFDVLQPFVLEALKREPQSKNALRKAIQRSHQFELPNHIIAQILRGLGAAGLAEHKGERWWLADGQSQYLELASTLQSIGREAAALAAGGMKFFQDHGAKISETAFLGLLDSLLSDNIQNVLATVRPNEFKGLTEESLEERQKLLLLAYLREVERSQPALYTIVEQFVAGALTSVVLRTRISDDESSITNGKGMEFFLDSNFILSLLGLQGPDLEAATKEVLDMVRKADFQALVMDLTVQEISHLLMGYPRVEAQYSKYIETDHVYSAMKRRGWTSVDVVQYVAGIENRLQEIGITVVATDINLATFEPQNPTEAERINRYRNYSNEVPMRHDLAAIDFVRARRGKRAFRFANARCFFLTCDWGLSKFNSIEGGHQADATIVEVILDVTLANILWMRNPSLKASLKTLVAANLASGAVTNSLWHSLREQVTKLRELGKIDDRDLEALFYRSFLQSELQGLNLKGRTVLSDPEVDLLIQKARQSRDADVNSKMNDVRAQALAEASQAASAMKQEMQILSQGKTAAGKEVDHLRNALLEAEKRQHIFTQIRAKRVAWRCVTACRWLAAVDFALVGMSLWLGLGANGLQVFYAVLGPVAGVVGMNVRPMWRALELSWTDELHRNMLAELRESIPPETDWEESPGTRSVEQV